MNNHRSMIHMQTAADLELIEEFCICMDEVLHPTLANVMHVSNV